MLIVHPPALAQAATTWAAYRARAGWRVQRLEVAPDDDAPAVQARARAALRDTRGTRAILLLGDAPPENAPPGGGVPTWYRPQPDPVLRSGGEDRFATDHPYQLLDDDDDAPDVALGRIPARTNDEALAVLAKIERYEANQAPGEWRRRIAYAAGEGHFGPYDALLESLFRQMVDLLVPEEFDISMMYAKATSMYCPPPDALPQSVLDRLSEGALLFNYIGHGSATALDDMHWGKERRRILAADDLQRLAGESPALPIALLTCCSAGWFDLADRASLAEAMLLHPSGPVAVIAGSRPTHPYANALLQKDVTNLLLGDRVATIGELDLRATRAMLRTDVIDRQLDAIVTPIRAAQRWTSELAQLRGMHVGLYNLLGDPATRIARPLGEFADFAFDGQTLRGRVSGMARGEVTITIETTRASIAGASRLLAVVDAADPDLVAKARHNYPLANDRVLLRGRGEVREGTFSVALAAPLPEGAAVARAYALGEDASGRAIDAFAALRLPRPPVPRPQPNKDPGSSPGLE